MPAVLHVSLVDGAVPIVLLALAAAGGIYLATRRRGRSWWTVRLPLVLAGAAAGAVLIAWVVDHVWQPFTDPIPTLAVVCIGVVLATLALLVPAVRRAPPRRRVLAALSAVVVVLAAANSVNQLYGYYPTIAAAFGRPPARQIPLPPKHSAHGALSTPTSAPDPSSADSAIAAGAPSSAATGGAGHPGTRPTHGTRPSTGAVSKVEIPGTVSGFHARPAWVYLPPAYLADPRPNLPVLVLIPGQPGGPANWMEGGHAVATLDAFAASHGGRAPITVMPDASGSPAAPQLCTDSALGNIDTYLSRDVPDWIRKNLQVDSDTRHWAVAGFSYGGTCALTLAIAHPELYPTFLDISGELGPTLGSPRQTIDRAFHGDAAAYEAVQPLRILQTHAHNPDRARAWAGLDGTFVVGQADRKYTEVRATVTHGCHAAGITVHEFTEPGTHSWYVAAQAFRQALPHLAERMKLE